MNVGSAAINLAAANPQDSFGAVSICYDGAPAVIQPVAALPTLSNYALLALLLGALFAGTHALRIRRSK